MKPARYLNRRLHQPSKIYLFLRLVLVFLFLVTFITLFSLWRDSQKEEKVLLVIPGEKVIYVVDFEFASSEMVEVAIPANTEVEAARNLGIWELSSIWKLGDNEKVGGGRLLTETLRDNIFAPVYYFSSERGKVLVENGPFSSLIFPFVEGGSNLSLAKKVRLALFSARFKKSKLTKIDLSKTSFLEEAKLKTGEDGYHIKGELPEDLLWVFADPLFLKSKIFVSMVNETGSSLVVGKISKILEAMGTKLGAVDNQNASDKDCEIIARDTDLALNLSSVFSCRRIKDTNTEANEIVIRIGKKFKERF